MRDNWQTVRLGDLCTIKGRIGFRGYTRQDLVEKGEGAITLSPSNIVDDKLNLDKCQYISWFKYDESPEIMIFEGDIIYAKTASIGKVALVKDLPEKATINPQFVVFKNIKCNRSFLYYAVRSHGFKEQVSLITNGVAIPTVSQSNLEKLHIKLPSVSEQQRIVDELDLLTGIIDKKNAQLRDLDALAQSTFYEMFGDPNTNERGWKYKALGDACTLKAGKGIKASELSEEKAAGLYPCFGGNGIRGYIAKKSHKGTYPIIGRQGALCGNVQLATGEFFATEHAVVCTPGEGLHAVFVYYALLAMNLNQYATGVAQPGLAVKTLLPIPIVTPPMELQERFAEKICNIESQIDLLNVSLEQIDTLFHSRMDYYFND